MHSAAKTVIFAVLHAALFYAAFAPLNMWAMIFVAPAPLAWLALHARSMRRAAAVVLVTQVVLWLTVNAWMHDVTTLGHPALAIYLALYSVLFVWIVRAAARHSRFDRVPMSLLLPLVWTGVEALRGDIVFHGYPWFLLAHPAGEAAVFVQSADLLGAYLVSFIVAAVAGAIVDLMRWHAGQLPLRRAVAFAMIAVAIQLANLAYGAVCLRPPAGATDGPTVLLLQTNLPQDNKTGWTFEAQVRDLVEFIEMTRAAHADHPDVDLIVWPETMVPGYGLEEDTRATLSSFGLETRRGMADAVLGLSRELDTPMLVGAVASRGLTFEPDGEHLRPERDRIYNSAYLIADGAIQGRYDKVFLTPFGETMPYISAWPWLEQRLLALGAAGMSFALDAAAEPRRLELAWSDGTCVLATPICFEDTVARVCRDLVYAGGKRADLLVNLSNDGWFGASDAGRWHHVQASRLRCVENRVPMLRCANTGLSVAFDAAGRLTAVAGGTTPALRRESVLVATPRLDQRTTLYGRVGDVWPWICVVGSLVVPILTRVDRGSRRAHG